MSKITKSATFCDSKLKTCLGSETSAAAGQLINYIMLPQAATVYVHDTHNMKPLYTVFPDDSQYRASSQNSFLAFLLFVNWKEIVVTKLTVNILFLENCHDLIFKLTMLISKIICILTSY